MTTAIWSIFGLLVLLGVLVTFHEWGHYWVAKKLGVKALRFSVGFGKPLWSRFNKHGTEFCIAPIPLGGYVKFVDEREGKVSDEDLPYAFNRQPVWKRILIVLAGPMANFLLAILVYAFVFMLGISVGKPFVTEVYPETPAASANFPGKSEIIDVGGKPVKSTQDSLFAFLDHIGDDTQLDVLVKPVGQDSTQTVTLDISQWQEPDEQKDLFKALGLEFGRVDGPAEIGVVAKDSAAERAGLKVGDRFVSIDGEPIKYWSDMGDIIAANPQQPLQMTIERDDSLIEVTATPDLRPGTETQGVLGVGAAFIGYNTIQYGFFEALGKGSQETWQMVERISSFLGKLVTGKLSIKNVGGPVGIAQGAGQTAQAGMVAFLLYLAMISVNLGFVNLLPIPMLDGGHLMYYLAELIRGKPVSERIMELGMRVGIILLLTLMAVALFFDIDRLNQ
ncbi:RIP metalloprotease RseP [Kangiella shandongensis]|uniref:RIP metalloprotease RseP n=1 Tax=Kangiella shandongensis TaxID=2763258 RepID=UPI001CBC57BA|nr:RIP metalloprotease RseP [Kangiella shandongensis]